MSMRLLPPGIYDFEDVNIGDHIQTAEIEITSAMIDRFAELTGDRFEIHMTDEGAKKLGFAARVAHGLLVLSLVDGLKNQCPAQFRAFASLAWDWSFRQPVLVGHRISASITVSEKRKTKRDDRSILGLTFEVKNETGTVVQVGRNLLMVQS
jgi:3-hydroxybutyryl-CoA dehydratase